MVRGSEICSAWAEFTKQSDMIIVAIEMLYFLFASIFLSFVFFNLLHPSPYNLNIKTVDSFKICLPMIAASTGCLAFPVFGRVGKVLQI
jgi:hypothetical protein